MATPIIVATHQGLTAAQPIVQAGRLPTPYAEAHDPRLLVVGEIVAERFDILPESGRDVLYLNGQPFVAIGVVRDRGVGAQISSSVVLSARGAGLLDLELQDRTILARTERGMGPAVGRWAPLAAYPENPSAVLVEVPPDPSRLRGQIAEDTRNLFLALGMVTLFGGAIGIANTMLVSVWERRSEIGVRRALGASRRAIAKIFLTEAMIIGTAGGLAGAAIGTLVGAAFSLSRGWDYSVPALLLGSPLLGTVVGILAGVHPAWRAARLDPIDSLRV